MLPLLASPSPSNVAESLAIIAAGRRSLVDAERSLDAMNATIGASRRQLAESYRLLQPQRTAAPARPDAEDAERA